MPRTVRARAVRTLVDMNQPTGESARHMYMQQQKPVSFARMVRSALATLGDGRRGSSAYAIERRALQRPQGNTFHLFESAAFFRYIEHVHWDRRPIDSGALKRAIERGVACGELVKTTRGKVRIAAGASREVVVLVPWFNPVEGPRDRVETSRRRTWARSTATRASGSQSRA